MSNSVSSLNLNQEVVENGFQRVELLSASDDEFGGVIVDMKEPMDPNVFVTILRASMSQWRQQGKRGIWIKLPIELVNLVETAVKEGFRYHHAEPNYLMLNYWIPETTNTIPANASHIVRIGAVIMNEKRQVLVVQEKMGKFQGTGVWKIPTGILDEGEDIFEGAKREVKEETGVETEFVEILAFRQSHKSFFEKSELFFLCMLNPLSFDIKKQDLEIEAAQWMPFEEYAAQPLIQEHKFMKYITDIWLAKVDKEYAGFTPKPVSPIFNDGISYFYSNRQFLKME